MRSKYCASPWWWTGSKCNVICTRFLIHDYWPEHELWTFPLKLYHSFTSANHPSRLCHLVLPSAGWQGLSPEARGGREPVALWEVSPRSHVSDTHFSGIMLLCTKADSCVPATCAFNPLTSMSAACSQPRYLRRFLPRLTLLLLSTRAQESWYLFICRG